MPDEIHEPARLAADATREMFEQMAVNGEQIRLMVERVATPNAEAIRQIVRSMPQIQLPVIPELDKILERNRASIAEIVRSATAFSEGYAKQIADMQRVAQSVYVPSGLFPRAVAETAAVGGVPVDTAVHLEAAPDTAMLERAVDQVRRSLELLHLSPQSWPQVLGTVLFIVGLLDPRLVTHLGGDAVSTTGLVVFVWLLFGSMNRPEE